MGAWKEGFAAAYKNSRLASTIPSKFAGRGTWYVLLFIRIFLLTDPNVEKATCMCLY